MPIDTRSLPSMPAVRLPGDFLTEEDSLLRPALGGPQD
jgi:hypothetical protein